MRPDGAAHEADADSDAPNADDDGCAHERALRLLRRDLHDDVGTTLSAVAMQLEAVEGLRCTSPDRAHDLLSRLRCEVSGLVEVVRRMAAGHSAPRSACGSPAHTLCTMLGRVRQMFGDRLHLASDLDPALASCPDEVTSAVFCVVREAVTNVLKHSRARHCWVRVSVRDRGVHVLVRDDGVGGPPGDYGGGSGLTNMTERATELDGRCSVRAAPSGGVRVLAFLPLQGPRDMGVGEEHDTGGED